jgi:cephalosporin-C deacetylase
MYRDMAEKDLDVYQGLTTTPGDFDTFWERTLNESRMAAGSVIAEKQDLPLVAIDVYDVTFPGFNGQPIKAWLKVPHGTTGPLPGVVQYIGYGGGRGEPMDNLFWAAAGFAHLYMDTRGQGSGWSRGETPDLAPTGPQTPGVMTRGIESPDSYYYRRLITDAVRAVDACADLRLDNGALAIDTNRIGIVGGSQGGGLTLAVAGLLQDKVAAIGACVPFLCDYRRAVQMTDSRPFFEITEYLGAHRGNDDEVYGVLSYFDGVNFARRATAPAHFTVALMDDIVPPSTIYAAFNNYAGPKNLQVWRHNGHESGGPVDEAMLADFFRANL